MGIRDRVNQNPRVAIAVAGVVVAAAIMFAVMHVWAGRPRIVSELPDGFFTVDDGKTYFKASTDNVAPFDRDGKSAVRAYVFDCKGKRFVGYLERYTPEGRKAMIEKRGSAGTQNWQREVKAPGEGTWVNVSETARANKIQDVHCPDGGEPEPVEP